MNYDNIVGMAQQSAARQQAFIANGGKPFYIASKTLGWTLAPNSSFRDGFYRSDERGFRRTEERRPSSSALDVISFWGDSLVFGGDVTDAETWLWQLQTRMAGRYAILNGGVSAYGTDQAYLRFKEQADNVAPRAAVLCYATTDLLRNVNIYRSFLHSGADFTTLKPRFRFRNDRLELLAPPVCDFTTAPTLLKQPETRQYLRENDSLYPSLPRRLSHGVRRRLGIPGRFSFGSAVYREALAISTAIITTFVKTCRQRDVVPGIILLPVFSSWYRPGRDFDVLLECANSIGVRSLDLRPCVQTALSKGCEVYTGKNHFGAAGGAAIVPAIAAFVENMLGRAEKRDDACVS